MYYDLLARIKNAIRARKDALTMPFSKFDYAVAKVLEDNGYLAGVEKKVLGKRTMLEVKLKFDAEGHAAITDFKIASKPSRHLYNGYKELRPVRQNYGMSVMSTSLGIMSNKEARKKKVGGEYLFEIW
jgi:small subunit ribosomal protein S8